LYLLRIPRFAAGEQDEPHRHDQRVDLK